MARNAKQTARHLKRDTRSTWLCLKKERKSDPRKHCAYNTKHRRRVARRRRCHPGPQNKNIIIIIIIATKTTLVARHWSPKGSLIFQYSVRRDFPYPIAFTTLSLVYRVLGVDQPKFNVVTLFFFLILDAAILPRFQIVQVQVFLFVFSRTLNSKYDRSSTKVREKFDKSSSESEKELTLQQAPHGGEHERCNDTLSL